MPKNGSDSMAFVREFTQRLTAKDRQLSGLKDLVLILTRIERTDAFKEEALPVLQKLLDASAEPALLFLKSDEPMALPESDANELEAQCAHMTDAGELRDGPHAFDLADEQVTPLLSRSRKAGHGTYVAAPLRYDGKDVGFLGFPRKTHETLSKDEEPFLAYLGEILGVFFHYVEMKGDLARAKEEMERRYSHLKAVYAVSHVIGSNLDLQTVLESALDTMLSQDVLNVQARGGVFLINEETGELDMVCHRNIGEALEKGEKHIPMGHCLCGRVAQTGEMITSTDCFTDHRHDTHYDGMQNHGHIIMPLKTGDKILGSLFLYLPPDAKADKEQIDMLVAITKQLSVSIENAQLYERVKHLAMHDPLTNTANRAMMFSRIEVESSRAERHDETFAVAIVDIDHFKKVNDTWGHQFGDYALKEVAAVLKEHARQSDLVARYGGEEFVLVLPNTQTGGVRVGLDRLREAVARHVISHEDKKGNPVTEQVTVSIGAAFSTPDHRPDGDHLIADADRALYHAKESGRNRVVVAGEDAPK